MINIAVLGSHIPLMIRVPKLEMPPFGMLPTTPSMKKRYSLTSQKASLTWYGCRRKVSH